MSAYKVLFIVIISTVLLCCHTSNAGPARQLALAAARASKIPRTIRAPFRNTEMMTARGFGKRRLPGSRSNEEGFLSSEITGDADPVQQVINDQSAESFPIDWFANELASNPTLIKVLLHRFVDTNRDGVLTAAELLSTSNDSNDLF